MLSVLAIAFRHSWMVWSSAILQNVEVCGYTTLTACHRHQVILNRLQQKAIKMSACMCQYDLVKILFKMPKSNSGYYLPCCHVSLILLKRQQRSFKASYKASEGQHLPFKSSMVQWLECQNRETRFKSLFHMETCQVILDWSLSVTAQPTSQGWTF